LFQVGDVHRDFPRDRIASIIWLKGQDESSPQPGDTSVVQVTDADGLSLSLASTKLDNGWITGTNELLGDCRLQLSQLGEVRIGALRALRKPGRSYEAWKLTSAIEPKAFSGDPTVSGEGHALTSDLIGRAAPDFTLELLDGSRFRLSKQRGKIVVLDFWASWCAPCMKATPDIAMLMGDFDPQTVQFVAVNLQETRDDIVQALERLKLSVPVALDRDGRVAASYAASSIPYTVVIGADGKIAGVFVGYSPRLADDVKLAIASKLAKE
jgi:thiol-disulfide isomerase/thioredoxin